jgi:poly(hydroxyalkanoate) depolymerase family esterase
MARRIRKTPGTRWLQRSLDALARSTLRASSKAVKQALRASPLLPKPKRRPRPPAPSAEWTTGIAVGAGGSRHYRLYRPPGVRRDERRPLLVMLHGCNQDAAAFAASTRMNRIAARERFLVLYPEQDRLANAHGCWNWFETRSGRAQAEAAVIEAAIERVVRSQPVDPQRIAIAGLSAGAGMAALLAARRPQRFRAVVMHSGIGPGVAHSSASALSAMHGRRLATPVVPLVAAANITRARTSRARADDTRSRADGAALPALLVIHGSTDRIVAPANGAEAVQRWAARAGARALATRIVQRGARHAAAITEHRAAGRVVATLCEVQGLGHAWSGGAAGHPYSDPRGPDASRMIWAFAARAFADSCTEA